MRQSKSKIKGIIEAKKMNDKQIQKFLNKNVDSKIDFQKLNNEKQKMVRKGVEEMARLETKHGVGFAKKGIDFPNTPEDLYEYHNTFLPSMNHPDEWVLTKTKKGFNAVLRNA
jgi:replication initiation and membrane attachment protein DnaB